MFETYLSISSVKINVIDYMDILILRDEKRDRCQLIEAVARLTYLLEQR